MKLSDTDLAAVEQALHISMATTKLQQWPDGLLLQLLQLDQMTRINEHMVALRKFHISAIDKVADLLDLIEKSLPTAPHVPDDEEAAETTRQAQRNLGLEHASIVDPVGARQMLFADLLAKNLPGITPNVVLATRCTEAMRAQGMKGFARERERLLWSAGFGFWGRARIGNDFDGVWVSESFQEILRKEAYPEQKILSYLAEVDFERSLEGVARKTPENVSCPPGTLPLGAPENVSCPPGTLPLGAPENVSCPPGTLPLGAPARDTGNVTVIDPDHYA